MKKSVFATLLGALSLLGAATLQAEPAALQGAKNCRFAPPSQWADAAVRWEGPCAKGLAHGSGILKAYRKNAATALFFGALKNGNLERGALEQEGAYLAGSFAANQLLPSDDRQALIETFAEASAIAKRYSLNLEKAGNKKSAQF